MHKRNSAVTYFTAESPPTSRGFSLSVCVCVCDRRDRGMKSRSLCPHTHRERLAQVRAELLFSCLELLSHSDTLLRARGMLHL